MKKGTLLLFSVLIAVLAIGGCNFIPTLTTGTISGKVVDPSNNPIVGATVSIPVLSMTTTTNSTGNFTFSQVNYGTYAIHTEHTDYQTPTDTNVSLNVNNPNPNITITMQPKQQETNGTVVVEVLKVDNTPITNATVNMGTYTGVTDAAGKVTWQQVPAGNYTVTAEKDGYISNSKAITVTAGQTTPVKFNLSPVTTTTGNVLVKVVDSDNTPIGGANVVMGSYNGTTLADGTILFNQIPVGDYTVNVTKSGYAGASKSISVTAGQQVTVDFILEPVAVDDTGTVIGLVTKPDQKPLAGATITMGTYSATTTDDGNFTFNQVPAGNYTVRAEHDGFEPAEKPIIVAKGQTTEVLISMKPILGKITGFVKDEANQPIADATISLQGTNLMAVSDPTGKYELMNIKYGAYTLTAFKEGFSPAALDVVVDQPLITRDITLQLPPGTTLNDAKSLVNDVNTSLYLLGDIYVDESSVIRNHFDQVMNFQAALAPNLQEMGSGLIHLQIVKGYQPGVYNFSTYDEYGYPIYEEVSLNDPMAGTWSWTVHDTFNGLHVNISVPNFSQHMYANETGTEYYIDFTGVEFEYSLLSDTNPDAVYFANIVIGSSNITTYSFVIPDIKWDEFGNPYEVPVTYFVQVPSGNTATARCVIEPDSDLSIINGIHIGATFDLQAIEDRHIFAFTGTIDTPVFHYYGAVNVELVGPSLADPFKYRFFGEGNFVTDTYTVHGNFDAGINIVIIEDEFGPYGEHVLKFASIHGGYDSPTNMTKLFGSFAYDFSNFNEFQFSEPISDTNYEKHHVNLAGAVDTAGKHYDLNLDVTRPDADVVNIHVIVNTPNNHIEGNLVVDEWNGISFLSMTNQAGIAFEFDFMSTDLLHLGRIFDRNTSTHYADIVGIPGVVDMLSVNFVDNTFVQFPLDFWSYIPH